MSYNIEKEGQLNGWSKEKIDRSIWLDKQDLSDNKSRGIFFDHKQKLYYEVFDNGDIEYKPKTFTVD